MTFRKYLLSTLFLVAMLAAAPACVNHSYDFDALEKDITIGGENLVLPLANTGQMPVSDLVGEKLGDLVRLGSDGIYALHYEAEPISFSFDGLKDYDGSGPFRRYINYPISYNFSLFSKPVNPAFDESGEADLTGYLPEKVILANAYKSTSLSVPRLPDELVGVSSITLSDDSRFRLTLSIPDCMLTEGAVIPDLSINLSEFFESPDAKDGVLHFDTPLTPENNFTASQEFHFKKVVFDPKNFDPQTHTLMLKAGASFDGKCTISGPRTDREHFNSASATTPLQISVILLKVDCVAVEGRYDYKISNINSTLNFRDVVDEIAGKIGDPDFSIELSEPEVLLDVTTNITVPTKANLGLQARKNRSRYAEINNILINFPYAEPGKSVSRRIRIARTPLEEEGVDNVLVDLNKLVSRIPDEIQVSVAASTRSDMNAELRLGDVYSIAAAPSLRIPLAFGANTKLTFRDTLSVSESLARVIRENEVQLTGELTNTLPVQIDMTLVLADDAGNAVADPIQQRIGAEGTSAISIPVRKRSGDAINRLSQAFLTLQVSGITQSRPIRATDYVQAKLDIQLPEGYRITF